MIAMPLYLIALAALLFWVNGRIHRQPGRAVSYIGGWLCALLAGAMVVYMFVQGVTW